MVKTKITLDTNLMISALGWKGNPKRVFEKIVSGKVELVVSSEQFNESSEVLDYPKFGFAEEQKNRFKSLILEIATFVKPVEKINLISSDPDDNMHLEAAIAGNAEYIISGDYDLEGVQNCRL